MLLPPELSLLSPDEKLALVKGLWEEAERKRRPKPRIDDKTWAALSNRNAEGERNEWKRRSLEEFRAELLR